MPTGKDTGMNKLNPGMSQANQDVESLVWKAKLIYMVRAMKKGLSIDGVSNRTRTEYIEL